MTREDFIDSIISALDSGARRSLIEFIRQETDLIYDPLLEDENERQLRCAAKAFEAHADQLYRLGESLRKAQRT